ncbi:MAG TPA: aspartate kinase [Polyangia bacterium]|jgi:aspartokinase/homoserine dehydrogenase 1|nr:aspartate kinase [Polyangia bacterium]
MPSKSAPKTVRKSKTQAKSAAKTPASKTAIGLEVHKFGGASLADAASYRHAAQIIKGRGAPCVVVVSAPAGVTDVLLGLARRAAAGEPEGLERDTEALRSRYREIARAAVGTDKAAAGVLAEIDASLAELGRLLSSLTVLKELTARTSDFIAARGERLSAQIFAATYDATVGRARYVDALEVIFTDGPFGGASPNLPLTDLAARKVLRPLAETGVVPVVPGFIGVAALEDGEHGKPDAKAVATLGRGGSDLTATLLGRALGADSVSLWKDVSGLLTADPRVVPDARVIPQLHAREAAELAYYGAKVLHPRALIPLSGLAATKAIPVFVKPFADPKALGTEISSRRTLDKYPVKALSAAGGQALLTVTGNGMLGVPGIAARTFEALFKQGTSVSLISQSSSEQSICFSVPEAAAKRARDRLAEEFKTEIARQEIDGVELQTGLATLAVVGLGMAGAPGIAARLFEALAHANINIVAIAQGSSELNISFVVAQKDSAAAQRAIHRAFQLAKIGGGAATMPTHTDAVLLGFGLIGRTLAEILSKNGASKNGAAKGTGARKRSVRLVGAIDRSGFVFEPGGLSGKTIAQLAAAKKSGKVLAQLPGGKPARPDEAVALLAQHALTDPMLVDVTADDTTPLVKQALTAGMDVVLANKRPLSASRADTEALMALAEREGKRIFYEATVGAGLPIFDTYRKLVESGDRVQKIEGCLSGTLGFLLTEVGKGRPFSQALGQAMELGYTEPDPRDDLSGMDVGRKALILGRLLDFAGEPADVAVESLVPEALRGLPRDAFLAKLSSMDADWSKRAAAAKAKGGTLRYVASVTKGKITVGLQVVGPSSPFFGLKGTDNQVAFTTMRYKTNPLVITGPGAGPAVTAAGVLNDMLGLVG